eukprot:TRINITY_DN20333_c0_g1_i1.p1 TRINITY_DN20333_c0_g1~~TRINITY_DN20333_c0_g1_i1.p1  ORF type:complete len:324 (-),score=84.73 TRINITY_DN20333_c0_g1_i1:148-1053(-)
MGLGKQQKKKRSLRRKALADHYEDESNDSEGEASEDGPPAKKQKAVGGSSVQAAMAGEDMSDPSGDEGDESEAEMVPVEGTLAEVSAMAIDEIRSAIANPDVQAGGVAFIPPHWAKRYKHMLGPYKKFVESHPDKFVLDEGEKGGFVVYNFEDVERPPLPKNMPWKAAINRAWGLYCKEVPKTERDFRLFLRDGLPDNAKGVAGGAFACLGLGVAKPEPMGNCPKKCGLVIFETATEGWSCNGCNVQAKLGAKLYGCRQCDYDICAECYIGRGALRLPQESAAPAKENGEKVSKKKQKRSS